MTRFFKYSSFSLRPLRLLCILCVKLILTQGACSAAAPSLNLLFTISGYSGYADFQSPACFFFDELTNKIYIVDAAVPRVYIYDFRGAPVRTITIEEKIKDMKSILVYRNQIYILHERGIFAIDETGEEQTELDLPAGVPEEIKPEKLISGTDGVFYVMDKKNKQIYKIDKKDDSVFVFGNEDDEEEKGERFRVLTDIYVDKWGRLLLLDADRKKIERYDTSGKFIGDLIKKYSLSQTDLFNPALIAVDSFKRCFVYDEGDRAIKIFDDVGFYKGKLSGMKEDGTVVYMFPKQMYFDNFNKLYILDSGDRMLKVFEVKGIN
ncbi:MAG: hypothetical protein AB1546_10550 [bacterium]